VVRLAQSVKITVLGLIGDALIHLHHQSPDLRALVLVYRFGQHAFLQSHRSSRMGFSVPAAAGRLAWLCRLDSALLRLPLTGLQHERHVQPDRNGSVVTRRQNPNDDPIRHFVDCHRRRGRHRYQHSGW
jgi:hypothetical protein